MHNFKVLIQWLTQLSILLNTHGSNKIIVTEVKSIQNVKVIQKFGWSDFDNFYGLKWNECGFIDWKVVDGFYSRFQTWAQS